MGEVVGERRAPLDLGAGAGVVVEAVAREVEGLVGGAVEGMEVRGAAEPAREAVGDAVAPGVAGPDGDSARRGAEGIVGEAVGDAVAPGVAGPDGDSAGRGAEGIVGDAVGDPVGRGAEGSAGDPAVQEEPASAEGAVADPVAEDAVADPVAQGAPPPPPALARNLLGVGVALPGPLDHAHGILHRVTGFPEWDGFPLRDALARRLGVAVVVDKDTNAAALGLAVAGEGGSFAYLHLGTGLGAGLVIGGGVHRGARTGAGEFGHQVIQLDGPPCGCGNRGCIEALCLAAVARGDLDEAARVLGTGAGNLVGLLDIDLVLLGGRTVAADPEPFVRGVAAVLDARARREGAREAAVPVRVAPGGARGVAEGAAQLLLGPLFGRADG
ncbi:ROK family protein [Streptomyces sp. NPDC001642]|uniref:ROK family protein n=1 Tax=Streptomyces sp. NPDC001642 TaxID=3154392 RepID=UPI00387E665A